MAIAKNVLLKGLSGMLGKLLVFRQVGERTYVASPPVFTKTRSLLQQQHHKRFKAASAYARSQMELPERKAAYARAAAHNVQLTPYNMALKDFFHAPEIKEVDLSQWATGLLRVQATDDFAVDRVEITLLDADGQALESGPAIPDPLLPGWWLYSFDTGINAGKLRVQAWDWPGNMAEMLL